MMKQVDIAIPIYCIASGHNFDLDYRWQLAGQNVGPAHVHISVQ